MTATTPTTPPAVPPQVTRGRGGPPLPAPVAAYAVLTVAAALTHPGVRPDQDAATVLATLQAHPAAAVTSATLLVAAAAPLAVLSAATAHRVRGLGARVAGPAIGLVGGVLASTSLLASGLTGWVAATTASSGDAPLTRALSSLSFAFGGVGFALGSALLLAGLSIPAFVLRLVPRPLAVGGLAVAVAGALSTLALPFPVLGPLLPVTRFAGLLVLIGLAVALPLHRRAAR